MAINIGRDRNLFWGNGEFCIDLTYFALCFNTYSSQKWLAQSNRRAIEGLGKTMRIVTADLFIFLQFSVIDWSHLGQPGSVTCVFTVIRRTTCSCCCCWYPTFLRTRNPFCQKCIIQSHELGIGGPPSGLLWCWDLFSLISHRMLKSEGFILWLFRTCFFACASPLRWWSWSGSRCHPSPASCYCCSPLHGHGGETMLPCTKWPARFTPARVCSIWFDRLPQASKAQVAPCLFFLFFFLFRR